MERTLEFWPEYNGAVLWDAEGNSVALSSLPVGDDLRERACAWVAVYEDEKLPFEGAGDPGWLREGQELLVELQAALPDYKLKTSEQWWEPDQRIGAAADTSRVHELLAKIIGDQDFDGRGELLAQVPHVVVVGGPITFARLDVDRSAAPRSRLPGQLVPGDSWAYDEGGIPLGTLLVWVDDGYLSALEYGWVTDDRPLALPLPEQVRSGPSPGPGSTDRPLR